MRRMIPVSLLLSSFAVACATPGSTDPGTTPDTTDVLDVVTEPFDVPTGDTFECFYTGIFTKEDLSVAKIFGKQGLGGHHITVYSTDSTQTGHAPCTDEEMTSWRMVGVADTEGGEPVVQLPDGLAFRLKKDRQIALQIHYINITGEPYSVQDEVSLHLVDPARVERYANFFTFVDLALDIPASAATTAVSTAVLKEDVPLISFGGHMHELGSHYKLELIDEKGQAKVVYDHEWSTAFVSHPPMEYFSKDEPLVLREGLKLRQTCTWNNTTPEDATFPREMCLMFGFYAPDEGRGEIIVPATPEASK